MRAGELLGRTVCASDGRTIGRVLDIRITRSPGTADPGEWRIEGVVIGRRRSFARSGYAYGNVGGPLPLAFLLRAAGRHLRYAHWSDLDVPTERLAPVVLRQAPDALPHPREV